MYILHFLIFICSENVKKWRRYSRIINWYEKPVSILVSTVSEKVIAHRCNCKQKPEITFRKFYEERLMWSQINLAATISVPSYFFVTVIPYFTSFSGLQVSGTRNQIWNSSGSYLRYFFVFPLRNVLQVLLCLEGNSELSYCIRSQCFKMWNQSPY